MDPGSTDGSFSFFSGPARASRQTYSQGEGIRDNGEGIRSGVGDHLASFSGPRYAVSKQLVVG